MLLLVLAGWPPTAAAWKTRPDWSKVQAVKPGTHIKVLLFKDQAPRGSRKIKGYFHSATDDSLTVERKDGQRHTFPKAAVRKVLVHRSPGKRYQIWVTAAVSAAIVSPAMRPSSDYTPGTAPFVIAVSTLIALIAAPRFGGIYNVTPRHGARPQKDNQSSAQSKASGNTSP